MEQGTTPDELTAAFVLFHLEGVIDELRRYVDHLSGEAKESVSTAMTAAEKAVSAALTAAKEMSTKSELNAEKWQANANEWRATMNDREAKFALKSETGLEFKAVAERLGQLEQWRAKAVGVALVLALFASAIGALIMRVFTGGS